MCEYVWLSVCARIILSCLQTIQYAIVLFFFSLFEIVLFTNCKAASVVLMSKQISVLEFKKSGNNFDPSLKGSPEFCY